MHAKIWRWRTVYWIEKIVTIWKFHSETWHFSRPINSMMFLFGKKQPNPSERCFFSTFQISKCFWFRRLQNSRTSVSWRGKPEASFDHFGVIWPPWKSNKDHYINLQVLLHRWNSVAPISFCIASVAEEVKGRVGLPFLWQLK